MGQMQYRLKPLSEWIGSIYDCALDPARWEQTLPDVRDALDCHGARAGQAVQRPVLGRPRRVPASALMGG